QAFKNKNVSFKSIHVYDTNNEVSEKLKQKFLEINVSDLASVARQEIIFIALHPPVIMETLAKIKEFVKAETVIISLAPKITSEKISDALANNNIVRLIPNATSYINESYNPVCFSDNCKDKKEIFELLSLCGTTFETVESKLEAYAISSAMLPTYFWFQWFEMIEIAKQIGLNEDESKKTIEESLKAALNTAFKSGLSQSEIIDLIPVKPIGENETQIKEILNSKLIGLFNKIKP
ncbi:MAG: hypothetical protein A2275_18310, partial [Bacteroidetes bacterium RIFOXYA12_FULL_35_11]